MITEKKTGKVLYIGETGLPINLRLNCHVCNSKKPGSGRFAGRRDEIEMKVIQSFDEKSEAYKFQCLLQTQHGFISDFEKLQNSRYNEDGILYSQLPKANKKRKKTMCELYGRTISVWKKKTGEFVGTFDSFGEMIETLNVDRRNVADCLKGKRYKSVSGYIFKEI
jgi:hypothetical protein